MSIPSSAPASTVGGWFSTGGYGIGSLKYGPLEAQVSSIEVVLADGQVRRLTRETHPPMQWFVGSEGTLGVVTEIELAVRPMRPMRHALIACADFSVVEGLLRHVLAGSTRPYSVHIDDRAVLAALSSLGFAPPSWREGELVRIDWEGPEEELDVAQSSLQEAIAATPGAHRLSSEAALGEWRERFRALRLKQGGPSVIGAELLLPVPDLANYLRDVELLGKRQRTQFMSYGHLANPDEIVVMTMCFADESREVSYLLDLALVKLIYDIGAAHRGTPYGLGFWNTPHIRPALMRPSLDELRRRKYELDPMGIMNPGKGAARLALMHPVALRLGMSAAAAVRRAMRGAFR